MHAAHIYWLAPFGLFCFFFGIYIGWRTHSEAEEKDFEELSEASRENHTWARCEQTRADILADELLEEQERFTSTSEELKRAQNAGQRLERILGARQIERVRRDLTHT